MRFVTYDKNGVEAVGVLLGPKLVTPDEFPERCDGLRITTRRNGQVVQSDSTSSMFWKVPEIIEMTSSYMSLEAGDVIGCEVEGIGVLRNPVVLES